MRVRADSALQAIRGGARFTTIASIHRGMKSHIAMRRDRLPDFWRGGSHEVESVFASAPGSMLPEPVRAKLGWALVRVDSLVPAHVAPLRDVANDIRAELRAA